MRQRKRSNIMRVKRIFNYFSIICVFSLFMTNAFSLRNKAIACMENVECLEEEYCKKADGDSDGEGECSHRPDNCPFLLKPVCGCDGLTYPNSCTAATNGVNVDYYGECKDCTSNAECSVGELCKKEAGDCYEKGICNERPDACIQVSDPVCGCDGITYSNPCMAELNGINIDHYGECNECVENDECSEGEFCKKDQRDCNGKGVCSDRPDTCLQVSEPVCGCDGLIYPNSCIAALNGINIAPWRKCFRARNLMKNRSKRQNYRKYREHQSKN